MTRISFFFRLYDLDPGRRSVPVFLSVSIRIRFFLKINSTGINNPARRNVAEPGLPGLGSGFTTEGGSKGKDSNTPFPSPKHLIARKEPVDNLPANRIKSNIILTY